jgi:ABC-type molybdate transport system substrate-binding protein
MRGDIRLVTLLLVATLAAAACSGGEDTGTAADEPGALVVYAPASLATVLQELAPEASFTIAGADELATRISEGANPDVFAADSARYPEELAASGYVERPQIFGTNRLVLVVSADNPAGIESLDDLGAPDVVVVVGAKGVPVGDYTRTVLGSLGAADVLDNVVASEDDVTGILDRSLPATRTPASSTPPTPRRPATSSGRSSSPHSLWLSTCSRSRSRAGTARRRMPSSRPCSARKDGRRSRRPASASRSLSPGP